MKRELCLVMAVLAGSATGLTQDALTPPAVKMGLWQNTATNTMTGLQLPPEVVAKMQAMGRPVPGAAPRTIVTQSCLTPDKWQKSFTDMQQRQELSVYECARRVRRGCRAIWLCTTAEGSSKGHHGCDVCEPGEDEREGAHGDDDGSPDRSRL